MKKNNTILKGKDISKTSLILIEFYKKSIKMLEKSLNKTQRSFYEQ